MKRFAFAFIAACMFVGTANAEEAAPLFDDEEDFVFGLQYPVEDHPNCDFRILRMEYRSGFGFLREDMFREFYKLITDTEGHLEADEFMNYYENTKTINNTGLLLRVLTACQIYIVS